MSHFTPFPKVNCRYGAPMGRASSALPPVSNPQFELCVSRPQGEYDSGGAYWGIGGAEGPVYAVWARGRGREGVVYVRAKSREAAIRAALGV